MMRVGYFDHFTNLGNGCEVSRLESIHHAKQFVSRLKVGVFLFIALTMHGFAAGPAWVAQGPSPSQNGNPTIPLQTDPVVGAIGAVLTHPTDPNTIYVAGVNGGIWKTTNGGTTWTPQTDKTSSLSITSLEFDPTDATFNTVIASVGRNSSFDDGGALTGVLRTTNGGTTWTELGANDLRGRNLFSAQARGTTILTAAKTGWGGGTGAGLYRSTDGGNHFDLLSGDGISGLPSGNVSSLVGDPTNNNRLYAAVLNQGVFRSEDAGATWTSVTNQITGTTSNPTNIKMSVGAGGAVFLFVVDATGSSATVWRSANQGGTWTQMDTPTLFPGGQGFVHGSILADPGDANRVYLGGDANGLSPIILRGDASAAAGSQFSSISGAGGTASGTSPHVDSRSMRLTATGQLVQGDDGGVYLQTAPTGAAGNWTSINGNLQVAEIHSIAYNHNTDRLFAGTQDNGSIGQIAVGGAVWTEIFGGDGAVVAVNDTTAGAGNSVRYYSAQFLAGNLGEGDIVRDKLNAANTITQSVEAEFIVNGQFLANYALSNNDDLQFYTPVVLNSVNQSRIVVGTSRIYVGTDDVSGTLSSTINLTDLNTSSFSSPVNAIYWGHVDNADRMLIGAGSQIWETSTSTAGSLAQVTSYTGGNVADVVFNTTTGNGNQYFAVDSTNDVIWERAAAGGWTRRLSLPEAQTLEFIGSANAILFGGAGDGVYFAKTSDLDTWFALNDATSPNAPIWDLDYDATDDVLAVGALGRGAFKLTGVAAYINTVAAPASIDAGMVRILRTGAAATTFGGGKLQAQADTTAAANFTLNAGGMTFDSNGFTSTLSGILSGAGGLTKSNTGTLILTGANTYGGATLISSGVLNVQNNAGLGTVVGGTTVVSGAALELQGGITIGAEALTLNGPGLSGTTNTGALRSISGNNSLAGVITLATPSRINSDSGTLTLTGGVTNAGFLLSVGGVGNTTFDTAAIAGVGGVTKDGTGVVQYNFANTYTGATTVNAGTLRLGAANVIDNNNAMTVSSPGTFDLNGNAESIGSLAGDGSVTLGVATLTTGNNGTSTTFSGVVSGAGGLTKVGAGTLTLSGANTYDGATAINVGVIRAQSSPALGSTVGGTTVTAGAALELNGGIGIGAEALTLNGTGVGAAGALRNISGANSFGGAITLGLATRINSDAGTLTLSGGITGAQNLTFGGAGDTAVNSVIGTGVGTLTKDGAGTLTLTGANTFTGATTVSNGTLSIDSIANGGSASPLGASLAATAVILGSAGNQGILSYVGGTGATDRTFTVGGAGGGRINNNGSGGLTLNGAINDAGNPFAIGGSANTTLVGNLAGAGALTKDGGGALTFSGAKTYTGATTVNAGTLALLAGSSANSSAFTLNPFGTISGFGSIQSLVNGGTVRPGDSSTIGAITIAAGGNYTQTAGGTFAPKVSSAVSRDQIIVAGGTATLNGSFSPSLMGGFVPQVGTIIPNLITSTGALTGTFSAVYDIALTLRADPVYNANSLDAIIRRDLTNPALGLDPAQHGVATSLTIVDNTAPTADLTTVLDAIAQLNTVEAVRAAYDQILPHKLDQLSQASINNTRLQNGNLSTRMNNLRAGVYPRAEMFVDNTQMAWNFEGTHYDVVGIPSEGNQHGWFDRYEDQQQNWGVFANGSAIFGEQDSDPVTQQTGYDFRTVGATLGVDYKVTNDFILGLAGGYNNTKTTVDNNGGSAKVDTISAGPYATCQVGDFYADAYGGYARNLYDMERRILFGTINRTAKGSPNGDQLFSYLGLGYDRHIGDFITGPILSLQYTRLWIDSYTETDAGSMNLQIDKQSADSLQNGLGWHWACNLKLGNMIFLPNISATYTHEYLNDSRSITAKIIGGSSFQTPTASPERDFVRVGAGFSALLTDSLSVSLGYNTQILDNGYTEQGVSGGVRVGF